MSTDRLHKILAHSGVASRRECERLIADGHVTIDGAIVRDMGIKVDPDVHEIRFDGERIRTEQPIHYLVYKPPGYLCTNRDEYGRPTVVSLIRDRQRRRFYTVGRLDEDSEGLILVTNDGEFANRVSHPRYGVDKIYALKLHGSLDNDALAKAREGVWLADGRTQGMFVKIIKRSKVFTNVVVRIREGKNRQLRRVFAKLGHAVAHLKRVRIGELSIKGMKRREVRRLTPDEVRDLLARCTPDDELDKRRTRHTHKTAPAVKSAWSGAAPGSSRSSSGGDRARGDQPSRRRAGSRKPRGAGTGKPRSRSSDRGSRRR